MVEISLVLMAFCELVHAITEVLKMVIGVERLIWVRGRVEHARKLGNLEELESRVFL